MKRTTPSFGFSSHFKWFLCLSFLGLINSIHRNEVIGVSKSIKENTFINNAKVTPTTLVTNLNEKPLDISGSSLSLSSGNPLATGATGTVTFQVNAVSIDGEYIPEIELTLPVGWSIACNSDDGGLYGETTSCVVSSNVVTYTFSGTTFPGLRNGNSWNFTIDVTMPGGTSPGDYDFSYLLTGDNFGDPPHTVSNTVSGGITVIDPPPTVQVNPITCTNRISNDDGSFVLTFLPGSEDKIGYSEGTTYTGLDYANADNIGSLPYTILNNIANPTSDKAYVVRVFDGSNSNYTDISLVMESVDCYISSVSYENTNTVSFVNDQCPNTDSSKINVPDDLLISDINIGFNSTIVYRHHVTVTVKSPSGTLVELTSNGVYSGASPSISNWDLLFDESSTNPLNDGNSDVTAAPNYENERIANPSGNLDDFNGENAIGDWTIYVCDYTTATDNGGTLNSWKIDVEGLELCSATGDAPISTMGTCNGFTPNNDATISINNIVNADRVGISTGGATSYDGVSYPNATAISGGNITFSGLEHGQCYLIRLFEPGGGCMTEVSVVAADAPTICLNIPVKVPWEGSNCNGSNIILQNGIGALTCGVTTATSASQRWAFALMNFDSIIPNSGRVDTTETAEVYHHPSWHVDSIGNVFGIAMNTISGDIFLTASANYGAGFLNNDAIIRYGAIGGGTASGNSDSSAGGVVYKIDGTTGQASVFSTLPQQSVSFTNFDCESDDVATRTNSGVGLGNIVYDKNNDQYFISNIEDGRIYRLDNSGTILDSYDPFANDDGVAGISNIEELVYGLAIESSTNRLFFGGVDATTGEDAQPGNPGIYSITLTGTGGFPGTINNTNMPSGATYDNYEQVSETFHTNIPIAGGTVIAAVKDDYVYLVSDLEFNANGDLIAGVRVSCDGSFFSSYNHHAETNIITKNMGTGVFNNSITELDVSAFGDYANEDVYGGVATYVDNSGNDIIGVSSSDILTESGPHGIAIFNDPPNSGQITPLAAVSYGVAGTDPKGVGGDINLWTSCTCVPLNITAFAIQPSCIDGVAQNDGYLQLSAVSGGNRFHWSQGSSFNADDGMGGTNDYTNANDLTTASYPLQFATGQMNPGSSQDYTIRVYNGKNECYTDVTVTMNNQDCTVGCDCKEQIYLNDTGIGHIEKFTVNSDSTLSQIGSPWLDAEAAGLNNPHGIAIDNNGFLYITDLNDQDVMKLDCDGNILDPLFIDFNQDVYNYFSIGNNLYLMGGNNGEVQVYDLCTGNQTHCISHWGGWGNTLGPDSLGYSSKGFNGSGNSIHSFPTDTSLYSTNLGSCPWYSTEVVGETALNNALPTPNTSFIRPMGLTFDNQGNLYVVINEGNFAGCALIQKYDSNFNYISQTAWDCDDSNGGWAGALGLIWSETSNLLYVSANDDCIAVFDTSLTNYPLLNVPFPPTTGFPLAKAIGMVEECCPINNNITIDTTLCDVSIGNTLFLQELVNCSGVVCEGVWSADIGNSGLTYNTCDNSITINAANACGTFTLESDGTGVNAQCGAFKVTVNINAMALPHITVSSDTAVCQGDSVILVGILDTWIGTPTYQWQNSTASCNTGFTNIVGATDSILKVGPTDTTFYRLLTSFIGNCSSGTCQDTSACISIFSLNCDWGDLPDTSASTNLSDYQTTRANNGPVHVIIPGLNLGITVDSENDGQPSADALDDGNDEDGIAILLSLDVRPGGILRLPLSYTNTTGNPAHIEAWLDWNGNGAFDSGEMVFDEIDPSLPYIEITVPNNALTDEYLGFRIRISNQDNMTPYGKIPTGEVEDYLIGINCPTQICVPLENVIIKSE